MNTEQAAVRRRTGGRATIAALAQENGEVATLVPSNNNKKQQQQRNRPKPRSPLPIRSWHRHRAAMRIVGRRCAFGRRQSPARRRWRIRSGRSR